MLGSYEYFFFHAIKSYFDLDQNQTLEVIDQELNIVHVYGSLGPIEGSGSIGFGEFDDARDVYTASQNIRTFTEGVKEETEMERVNNWCEEANVLLFLGFAYLPLNLAALTPKTPFSKKQVLGTAFGLSADNLEIAKNILNHRWFDGMQKDLDLRSITCSDLLSDVSGLLGEYDIL